MCVLLRCVIFMDDMSLSIIIGLLVCSLSAVLCLHQDVLEHLADVKQPNCSEPQLRFVDFKDLVPKEDWTEDLKKIVEHILPRSTLVRKCQSSGYCKTFNTCCAPIAFSNVTVPFGTLAGDVIKVKITHEDKCECRPNTTSDKKIIKKK